MINWNLVSHPMNWVTVFLMVLISAIAVTLVLNQFSPTPPESSS